MIGRKKSLLTLMILFIMTLTGCGDQKIFEQVGFALQAGMELKGNKVIISITLPVISQDKNINAFRLLVIEDAKGAREAREKSRMKFPSSVEAGKIQQIVFSSQLAEAGVHKYLDVFERDATNPILAYVVVSEGSPKDLFKRIETFPEKPRPAIYINQLLESNIRSSYIPETRLYNFDIEYYSKGVDPMVPMIKAEEMGISVVGSALFSEDKMVGKIDTKQTVLLLAMRGRMKPTEYITLAPNNSCAVSVMIKKVKSKNKIYIKDKKVFADISLKFDGNLDEYAIDNLDDPKTQKELEGYVAAQMKRECEEILKYTQQVGSDPIGIGNMVRAKNYDYWKSVNWDDAYKNIVFNVDVSLNLRHHGVVN